MIDGKIDLSSKIEEASRWRCVLENSLPKSTSVPECHCSFQHLQPSIEQAVGCTSNGELMFWCCVAFFLFGTLTRRCFVASICFRSVLRYLDALLLLLDVFLE